MAESTYAEARFNAPATDSKKRCLIRVERQKRSFCAVLAKVLNSACRIPAIWNLRHTTRLNPFSCRWLYINCTAKKPVSTSQKCGEKVVWVDCSWAEAKRSLGARLKSNGFALAAVGRAWILLGSRKNSKPEKCLKKPQTPNRPLHAGVSQLSLSAKSHRCRPAPTLGAKLIVCTMHIQASPPNTSIPAPSRHKLRI